MIYKIVIYLNEIPFFSSIYNAIRFMVVSRKGAFEVYIENQLVVKPEIFFYKFSQMCYKKIKKTP